MQQDPIAEYNMGYLLEEKKCYEEAAEWYLIVLKNQSGSHCVTAGKKLSQLILEKKIHWNPNFHSHWPEVANFKEIVLLMMLIRKNGFVSSKPLSSFLPKFVMFKVLTFLSDIYIDFLLENNLGTRKRGTDNSELLNSPSKKKKNVK